MATLANRPSTKMINDHVGIRVRERRVMLGLTQTQLAELIGCSFQTVHKYECGINPIKAGMLYRMACALHVSVTYFYEDLGNGVPRRRASNQRMLLLIAHNFAEIRNEEHRELVVRAARALAGR